MIELMSIIKELGFPTIVFVIAISVILYLTKKEEKRQILNDKRYDELTNKFIDTIKKISDENNKMIDENNKMLKELSDSMHNVIDVFDDMQKR